MDGDDGVSKKSRTQGQRKTTWTPQNKTVNLFFFFQNHTIDSICYICVGGKAFSFFMFQSRRRTDRNDTKKNFNVSTTKAGLRLSTALLLSPVRMFNR